MIQVDQGGVHELMLFLKRCGEFSFLETKSVLSR